MLQGVLQGVLNIADDILVFGRTESKFNTNVISFLDRCVQEDIHLNPDKVKINTDSIQFFSHVLTKNGIQPDESKVKLILDWPIPENQKELQQFMGLVNYLSKFLAFLSDLHAPLQLLLKKDSEFIWTDTHTIAFNHLKEHVSNDVKLQFFYSSKPYTLKSMLPSEVLVQLCYNVTPLSRIHLQLRFQTIYIQSLMLVRLCQKQNLITLTLRENCLVLYSL